MSAQTQPYVRTAMLPPVHPPAGQAGAVKWLRENLFSGALNTVLTLLSLAAVLALLWAIVPWFWNSVWFASSLDGCRETLKERAGLGADDPTPLGACFAVITERWQQMLYGFYPQDLYWRANLNLLLLFVALVPVLFTEVSARTRAITAGVLFVLSGLMVWGAYWSEMGTLLALAMLVLFAAIAAAIWRFDISRRYLLMFAALYPFLAVWLIWGGSIWGPIAVLATAGIGVAIWRLLADRSPQVVRIALAVFGAIGLGVAIYFVAGLLSFFMRDMGYSLLAFAVSGPTPFAGTWYVVAGFALRAVALVAGVFLYPLGWVMFALTYLGPIAGPLMLIFGTIRRDGLAQLVLTVVFVLAYLLLGAGLLSTFLQSIVPLAIESVESRDLGGFMVSIIIGVAGIALSLPIGIVLALGRQSKLFIVHTLCVGFIEFIRGVPLITLLFTASLLLNYFLPPGTNFDIILRVIIMVTLFASAYMAETIRGGLAALPRGQYEAADSLGLDYWKAQRLIVMPQALKVSIPGIVNNFIGLFKDTTLVTFIGILDILNFTNSIRANAEWHGIYWELYLFVGFMFFIACFPMGRYSKWLEGKLRTDHR